ncbi:MAG: CBS domain-containing protein [Gemmatimonadota bacterium]|nr:CBS domain-containing protein [Gemmatimonadota bacterium]
MNVDSILGRKDSTEVRTIGPESTIAQAIERLVEHNIGSLVVVDEGDDPVGIITERDILRCCANDPERLRRARVADEMSRDLIVGQPGDDIDYVMGVMTKNRIRHLPIVDGRDLVGMVSIGDVVNVQLQETRYENRHLRDYITGTY